MPVFDRLLDNARAAFGDLAGGEDLDAVLLQITEEVACLLGAHFGLFKRGGDRL